MKIDLDDESNNSLGPGIYAVYADHTVYGRNVLIYIGRTKRDIKKRIGEHGDFIDTNLMNFEYYFGEILNRDDVNKENLESAVIEIETLLINAHCPAYNANAIKGIINTKEYYKTVVLNWDDRGAILPEVSGLRYSSYYWDDWDKKTKHFGHEHE